MGGVKLAALVLVVVPAVGCTTFSSDPTGVDAGVEVVGPIVRDPLFRCGNVETKGTVLACRDFEVATFAEAVSGLERLEDNGGGLSLERETTPPTGLLRSTVQNASQGAQVRVTFTGPGEAFVFSVDVKASTATLTAEKTILTLGGPNTAQLVIKLFKNELRIVAGSVTATKPIDAEWHRIAVVYDRGAGRALLDGVELVPRAPWSISTTLVATLGYAKTGTVSGQSMLDMDNLIFVRNSSAP